LDTAGVGVMGGVIGGVSAGIWELGVSFITN
jgi:hypothetical protein